MIKIRTSENFNALFLMRPKLKVNHINGMISSIFHLGLFVREIQSTI